MKVWISSWRRPMILTRLRQRSHSWPRKWQISKVKFTRRCATHMVTHHPKTGLPVCRSSKAWTWRLMQCRAALQRNADYRPKLTATWWNFTSIRWKALCSIFQPLSVRSSTISGLGRTLFQKDLNSEKALKQYLECRRRRAAT